MADDKVVCPACDLPIDPDATSCPGCGADFTMQGIDELELVARDLTKPENAEAIEGPSPGAQAVPGGAALMPAESTGPSVPSDELPRTTEQKKRRFPRLFGRS